MILVDLNQVMISNLMAQIHGRGDVEVSEDLLRHMVLNSLRANRVKFNEKYGELVICCDDTNNWRKKLFPYYKAHRKKNRDDSEYDWPHIFNCLNNVRDELKEFFPYKVIQVDTAEADDVIGVLCHQFGKQLGEGEPILILSGDKDFVQLQKFVNVDQYDPIRKRKVSSKTPEDYLIEHIAKGDRGDGIPNILSKSDTFVSGGRQKPMRASTLAKIKEAVDQAENDVDLWKFEWFQGFNRNRAIIDLQYTPDEIREQVMNQFDNQNKDRAHLFNYFVKKKLNNLIENISEF
jgi:hypothetical protein